MEMAPMYRKFVAATLSVAMILGTGTAAAVEKRVTVNTGDTFVVNWRDGWSVGTAPPEAPDGTLVFHGGDAKKWRVVVAPLPPHPTLTGDVGNLRIYLRTMSRAMENGGVQVEQEQKTFDGTHARGFYVKVHDPNPKAHVKGKDDPFSDGYTGAVSLASKPYLFEVVWNAGSEPDAIAAFAALKSIRKL
jgi:hypothetical protein